MAVPPVPNLVLTAPQEEVASTEAELVQTPRRAAIAYQATVGPQYLRMLWSHIPSI